MCCVKIPTTCHMVPESNALFPFYKLLLLMQRGWADTDKIEGSSLSVIRLKRQKDVRHIDVISSVGVYFAKTEYKRDGAMRSKSS
ncbi:hypothetical protein TNIN_137371 [Trichonephila inaurata madagascariensis]|uniref:Uncharacterized protein n=1 Tax=Trichonephila inaurata madagascariensis TaxID=2747483 RepID=A0A8X6JP16_9ARAC|nr:hypothetical protein TNIN_137371 [Trichonephila inaurata madagascariensis]